MVRAFWYFMPAGSLLALALGVPAQEPFLESKASAPMSSAEVETIRLSRGKAHDEILKNHSQYDAPEIAGALEQPNFLIAIAKVTSVTPSSPYLRIDFEIQQFWRGNSDKTHIYAESRWRPEPPPGTSYRIVGPPPTALDRVEPKPGNLFLIGYDLHIYGDSGTKAYIPGAIDFSAPGLGQIFAEIQHFLSIDAAAGDSNVAPFVAALNDPVPWIRDATAHRMIDYIDNCRTSTTCGEAILARAGELLHSKDARARYEAIQWLERLALRARAQNSPSSPTNSALRDLLTSAISDPNVVIGDRAFDSLQEWDFYRNVGPGHCLEVIPELRRSAVWDYNEVNGRSIRSPLGSSMSCLQPVPATTQ
ncbi:MAG: hypothetical protein ACJ71Q_09990 [Terriglobales bacterium]|jgi:hypothetical protein